MRRLTLSLTAASIISWSGIGIAQQQSVKPLGRPVTLDNAKVDALQDVLVPTNIPGVLEIEFAKEGTVVKKGQELMRIYDKPARLELEQKELDARNEAPVKMAKYREEEQAAQLDSGRKLYEKKMMSVDDYRILEVKLKFAMQQGDDAKVQWAIKKQEALAAAEKLALHGIRSPVDGIIVKQYKQAGESVAAQDPIFRIIKSDVVKLTAPLDLRYSDFVRKGMPVEVYPNRSVSEIYKLYRHSGAVTAVKVSRDGQRCISAGEDGAVIVWNISNGTLERVLGSGDSPVSGLGVTVANPNLVVAADVSGNIRGWDLSTGKKIHDFSISKSSAQILCVALSPTDADLCATGDSKATIRLWQLSTGKEIRSLAGHTSQVESLSWTEDGKFMLSSSMDQTARFWNMNDVNETRVFKGRSADIRLVGMSPGGRNYAFNHGSVLQVRTLPDDAPIATMQMEGANFADIAVFTPISGMVLTGHDQKHSLQLWQMRDANRPTRLVRTFEGHIDNIRSVDFAPDESFFVTGAGEKDRSVRVWKLPSNDQIAREVKTTTVNFVNDQVQEGSSSTAVIVEVDNKDGALRPGGSATIVVYPERIGVMTNNN